MEKNKDNFLTDMKRITRDGEAMELSLYAERIRCEVFFYIKHEVIVDFPVVHEVLTILPNSSDNGGDEVKMNVERNSAANGGDEVQMNVGRNSASNGGDEVQTNVL